MKYLSRGLRLLDYLRNGISDYDSCIRDIREEARKGGFSLADIGTNEKEIEELRVKGCKAAAHMWLDFLRHGASRYDSCICYVREEATKGNLSLADIGTNEEELEELRVKGCKTVAYMWLGYLRNGTSQHDSCIHYVREEARKGGFSLADIGTSKEELASFSKTVTG